MWQKCVWINKGSKGYILWETRRHMDWRRSQKTQYFLREYNPKDWGKWKNAAFDLLKAAQSMVCSLRKRRYHLNGSIGTREIISSGRTYTFHMTDLVWSPAPQVAHLILPGLIPEHRARNKPWIAIGVAPKP